VTAANRQPGKETASDDPSSAVRVFGVPDRPAATPETYASGPFVSIRAGGPFNGVVTITAVADGNGRVLVKAAWTRENKPQSAARILDSYDTARTLARQWADQLAAGAEPPPG
jgi:hypothetical protein